RRRPGRWQARSLRQGRAHEGGRHARPRCLPRRARTVRIRRPARLLLARLARRTRAAREAQLSRRPDRTAGRRREDHDPRRPARPARPPEGLRLRGYAEAPGGPDRGRHRTRSRLGPDDRCTCAQRRVDDGTCRPGRVPRLGAGDGGPPPYSLPVPRGDAGWVDGLADRVGDGIYITRLHYLGVIDPRGGIVTGMTRDGTFRIRDGKLAEPLVNLRFTVSVPDMLRDVYGLTRRASLVNSQNCYGDRYPYSALGAALATRRCPITGVGSKPGI